MTVDAAVALARELAPELHHRTGRTLAQTRAWAVDALARAENVAELIGE